MNNESKKSPVGLPEGTQIGKYRILARIKIGGQAIIYKAYDSMLDRDVAIKQISTHLAENEAFLERFRKEARILAKLGVTQPAIVTIHELIEDQRGLFIVMEFVPGKNLEEILSAGGEPIEIKAALRIIWRLAAALHSVHSAGIIHRDVKPANIMVSDAQRVKIADFGVAASISGQTSLLLGTTKYLAPELFSGSSDVDGRVDVYSLGFIAYEMLVGRTRFKEIFSEVMRDPHSESLRWMKWHGNPKVSAPTLHEVNPAVPEAFSEIVMKMMAKNPDDRYRSMEELGRVMKSALSPQARAQYSAVVAEQPPHEQDQIDPAAPQAQDESPFDEPITAPLPKKTISLRTKLILSAVVFLIALSAVVVMAVFQSSELRRRQSSAETMFNTAWDYYDTKTEYQNALGIFEDLMKKSPRTSQSAKASVIVHLCRAQMAVAEHRWQDAQEHESFAMERLKIIQAGNGELYNWTVEFRDYIKKFRDYRLAAWRFREDIAQADRFSSQGKFDSALAILDRLDRPTVPLTDMLRKEMGILAKAVKTAKFMCSFNSLVVSGDGFVGKGDLDAARAAYLQARDELQSDQSKVVPKDNRETLLKRLNTKLGDLDKRGKYEDEMAAATTAKQKDDKTAEILALRRACQIKPSKDLLSRIKYLRSAIDLDSAINLARHDPAGAVTVLEKLIEHDPENSQARVMLKNLQRDVKWQAFRDRADESFRRDDLDKALVDYRKANEIRTDDSVTKRIDDCNFKILMKRADSLRRKDKLAEAIETYEKARAIKPERDRLISSLQSQLAAELNYRNLLSAGDGERKLKRWSDAINYYRRAAKLKNSAEINTRIAITRYQRFKALGESAMKENDPKSAKAYFNRAKGVMQTKEIQNLINHAAELIKAQKPE